MPSGFQVDPHDGVPFICLDVEHVIIGSEDSRAVNETIDTLILRINVPYELLNGLRVGDVTHLGVCREPLTSQLIGKFSKSSFVDVDQYYVCLLYTSPSPRDRG